jgi:Terpene synthase family 2, C-terminal metal binding
MYMQVRHMAVGVAPCHDLMSIASQIAPEPIRDNFFIRRIERLAINYSIWINDLAGLNRDQKRGLANVIFTIQKDHSLALDEAARMVGRMCDDELKAFFQLERQMPTLLQPTWERDQKDVIAYNDVLRRWMRGLLDWSARSDRYQRLNVDMSLQSEATIREAASRYQQSGLHS